jgi:hypothetical protein
MDDLANAKDEVSAPNDQAIHLSLGRVTSPQRIRFTWTMKGSTIMAGG